MLLSPEELHLVRSLVVTVADHPKPGIVFRDVSPVLSHARSLALVADALADRLDGATHVAGIEARGFVLAAAVAARHHCGFVALRKPGKLPRQVLREEYVLEYGTDALEVHTDALPAGARVLLVDDVLATGGTLAAGASLLRRQGAVLVGAAVLVELVGLAGRAALGGLPLHAVLEF